MIVIANQQECDLVIMDKLFKKVIKHFINPMLGKDRMNQLKEQ